MRVLWIQVNVSNLLLVLRMIGYILISIGSDNADKVIIASQDQELVYDLRRIPGVNKPNFYYIAYNKRYQQYRSHKARL